jgi:hypothetical protein
MRCQLVPMVMTGDGPHSNWRARLVSGPSSQFSILSFITITSSHLIFSSLVTPYHNLSLSHRHTLTPLSWQSQPCTCSVYHLTLCHECLHCRSPSSLAPFLLLLLLLLTPPILQLPTADSSLVQRGIVSLCMPSSLSPSLLFLFLSLLPSSSFRSGSRRSVAQWDDH